MRKLLCMLTFLALTFATVAGFAATKTYKYLPKTTSGKPYGRITNVKYDDYHLASLKAQNHLTAAQNSSFGRFGLMARKGSYINGTGNTIPYFGSWYITGARNSIYPFSMVGHSPSAGGTTGINNQLIPLVTVLQIGGQTVATFDPTVNNDPQGTDMSLIAQSPLYDATTTYPGPPAETGQFDDSHQRVSFRATAAANWHTVLTAPLSSGIVWVQVLEFNNGDWAFACCDSNGNNFPVFNINVIAANFESILASEAPLNTTVPIIVTDYLTAFDPSSGGCCILGFHSAQSNTDGNGPGVLVWTWATYIANSANSPFGPFGRSTMVLSHELDELFNDPFVQNGGTAVSPWVDGSVSFAQGNLETGDVIEGMAAADVIYFDTLNTTGGAYLYSLQNVANLEWFTRNPFNGGIYSWPNEHTLGQAPHVQGSCQASPTWTYGQGSAGFFFCNSNTGW
jgi:hypothetical protein